MCSSRTRRLAAFHFLRSDLAVFPIYENPIKPHKWEGFRAWGSDRPVLRPQRRFGGAERFAHAWHPDASVTMNTTPSPAGGAAEPPADATPQRFPEASRIKPANGFPPSSPPAKSYKVVRVPP